MKQEIYIVPYGDFNTSHEMFSSIKEEAEKEGYTISGYLMRLHTDYIENKEARLKFYENYKRMGNAKQKHV